MRNSIPVKVEVKGDKVIMHLSERLSRVFINPIEFLVAKSYWEQMNMIILEEEGILHFDPKTKVRNILLISDMEEEDND